MAGLNTTAILDAIVSNALALGVFDKVNTHEPKSQPGPGLVAAIWCEDIEPYAEGSGLNVTSALVTYTFRIYKGMVSEPQDMIDPQIMNAVDALMNQYSGDFDLGSSVRNVDLLGMSGKRLSARAGYLNLDGRIFRVFDVSIPLVINDCWTQVS